MKQPKTSNRDKLIDYVAYYGRRPFTSREVSEYTGIPYSSTTVGLRRLLRENVIKDCGIRNKIRYYRKIKKEPEKPPPKLIINLETMNLIFEKVNNVCLSELEVLTGFSHGTVFRYVAILLSMKILYKQSTRLFKRTNELPEEFYYDHDQYLKEIEFSKYKPEKVKRKKMKKKTKKVSTESVKKKLNNQLEIFDFKNDKPKVIGHFCWNIFSPIGLTIIDSNGDNEDE